MEIRLLARLVAEEMEGAHLFIGHRLDLAIQFQSEQRHTVADCEDLRLALRCLTLFYHTQHHHMDQDSLLIDVIGREQLHLRFI